MRKAFTLAEVLITLGIIGIVAALTMPSLITKYQKLQTVTKLKKFYTNVNQAIRLSETENGPAEYWEYSWGTGDGTYNEMYDFYNKYLAKYLVVTKTQQCNSTNLCLYFPDGTSARLYPRGGSSVILLHENAEN